MAHGMLKMSRMNTVHLRITLLAIWLLAVAGGIGVLLRYENTPGQINTTPRQWPEESRIQRPKDGPILLMFAHPECPCTRASIDELNRLLARCRGQLVVEALFFQPASLPQDHVRGSLWQRAEALPGISVRSDPDGLEARRFGAETSGRVWG